MLRQYFDVESRSFILTKCRSVFERLSCINHIRNAFISNFTLFKVKQIFLRQSESRTCWDFQDSYCGVLNVFLLTFILYIYIYIHIYIYIYVCMYKYIVIWGY